MLYDCITEKNARAITELIEEVPSLLEKVGIYHYACRLQWDDFFPMCEFLAFSGFCFLNAVDRTYLETLESPTRMGETLEALLKGCVRRRHFLEPLFRMTFPPQPVTSILLDYCVYYVTKEVPKEGEYHHVIRMLKDKRVSSNILKIMESEKIKVDPFCHIDLEKWFMEVEQSNDMYINQMERGKIRSAQNELKQKSPFDLRPQIQDVFPCS